MLTSQSANRKHKRRRNKATDPFYHIPLQTKDVNKSLLNLHKVAEENNDPQLCDFIETEYLEEQVEAIKKIADLVTQLNRVGGDGLGCKFSLLA